MADLEGILGVWLQIVQGETLSGWWEAGGLYIGLGGWPVDANALGTPLVRPVIAFLTAGDAYELRFGQNFDLCAESVEPVDRTSLR